ncbi:hypothetical protein [Streptomyces sp. NRRL S-241]|nr:hypothetical protein [Streptomyces sp. NRRL S-241]
MARGKNQQRPATGIPTRVPVGQVGRARARVRAGAGVVREGAAR